MATQTRFSFTYRFFLLLFSLTLTACGGGGWWWRWSHQPQRHGDSTSFAVTPANGAIGIEPDIALGVTFSEAMLGTSIDNTTILLQGTAPVAASVSFDGNAQATLTPNARLALMTDYVASVTTAVADLAGNALAVWYQFDGSRFNIWANRFE